MDCATVGRAVSTEDFAAAERAAEARNAGTGTIAVKSLFVMDDDLA
ncbi:hypothetical protein [Sphingobium sp. SCG-1]|nr:hypothetical protein [Sphingobium sp. SCG-1]